MSRIDKRQRVEQQTGATTNPPPPLLQPTPPPPPPPPHADTATSTTAPHIDFSSYHHVNNSDAHSSHHTSPHSQPPLPVRLWGLDPLFFTPTKHLISHILTLPHYESLPASATTPLSGRPVLRCEVVGVVVGRVVKDAFTLLHVDDSSGVLRCKVWTSQGGASGGSSSDLSRVVDSAARGVCVRCVGRLHEWQGVRELNVEWVRVEEDSRAEMLHWLECMRLYDECYRQPSAIMQHHQQQQQRDAVT